MPYDAIANLRLAIRFTIVIWCVQIVSIGMLIWATSNMRKTDTLYSTAAESLEDACRARGGR